MAEQLKIGDIIGGFRYVGGDPNNRRSWAKVERPSGVEFFTRGASETLGAMMDPIIQTSAERGPGSRRESRPTDPVAPETSVRSRLPPRPVTQRVEQLGVPIAPREARPESLAEAIPFGAGVVTGALPAGAGLARAGATLPGRMGRIAESRIGRVAREPLRVAGEVATVGAGLGTGGMVAEKEFPGSIAAQIIGELTGGLLLPIGITSAAKLAQYASGKLSGAGGKVKGALVSPFTEEGARAQTAQVLQEQVAATPSTPGRVLRRMERDVPSETPTAARTREPLIHALEREVVKLEPKVRDKLARQKHAATLAQAKNLRTALQGVSKGDPAVLKSFAATRKQRLFEALENRIKVAGALIEDKLQQLAPRISAMGTEAGMLRAARIISDEVESAYGAANKQLDRLSKRIPKSDTTTTLRTRQTFARELNKAAAAQKEDMPSIAAKLLSPGTAKKPNKSYLGKETSVKELLGLRSKLLEIGREARKAGKRNTVRLVNRLADAALKDLNASLSGRSSAQVKRALEFANVVDAKFRRSKNVAGVLQLRETPDPAALKGTTRTAAEAPVTPAAAQAQRALGTGGTKSAEAIEQLVRAAPASGTLTAVRDHVVGLFTRAAVKNGQVVEKKAQTWINKNSAVIEQVPGLRRELENVASAQVLVDAAKARATRAVKLLGSEKKSVTSRIINAPVDKEVERIMGLPNPAGAMKRLKNLAVKDESGEAFAGLKTAFTDFLFRRGSTKEGLLSGARLSTLLQDKRFVGAARALLNTTEMRRLRIVVGELKQLKPTSVPATEGLPLSKPAKILDILARITGAGAGTGLGRFINKFTPLRRGGGAGIVEAQVGAQFSKEFLQKANVEKMKNLLIESVQDAELFAALLKQIPEAAAPAAKHAEAWRRLDSWLLGVGRNYYEEVMNEPLPPQQPGQVGQPTQPQQLQPGSEINGWQFKGGDPQDPDSWEPITPGAPKLKKSTRAEGTISLDFVK